MVIFLAKFPALLLPAIWWTIKGMEIEIDSLASI